jgi:hypothetical protein
MPVLISVRAVEEDPDDFGWEEIYRLYGISTDAESSSHGEQGSSPTPLTYFSIPRKAKRRRGGRVS